MTNKIYLIGLIRNKKFARACLRDCLSKGEAPYASHLLYAQEGILNDDIAEERALGIHAGLILGKSATKTIVYTDLGISSGRERGIKRARDEGRTIEYRELGFIPEVSEKEVLLEKLRQEVEKDLKNDNYSLDIKLKLK